MWGKEARRLVGLACAVGLMACAGSASNSVLEAGVDGVVVDGQTDGGIVVIDGRQPDDAGATSDGASDSDPCRGMVCDEPPLDYCLNGELLRSYRGPGSCSEGLCSYAYDDQPCAEGPCEGGGCSSEPCSGVVCDSPPPNGCADDTTRKVFKKSGTCNGGDCSYASYKVNCDKPPADGCADGHTRRLYDGSGTCNAGKCSYPHTDEPCAEPPADTCVDATTRQAYVPIGACSGGQCSYSSTDEPCDEPPAPVCANGTTRRVFSGVGTCSGGVCGGFNQTDEPCDEPPADRCVAGGTTLRQSTAPGSCDDGACKYPHTDKVCDHGCAAGACLPCAPSCGAVPCGADDGCGGTCCQTSTSCIPKVCAPFCHELNACGDACSLLPPGTECGAQGECDEQGQCNIGP